MRTNNIRPKKEDAAPPVTGPRLSIPLLRVTTAESTLAGQGIVATDTGDAATHSAKKR